MKTLFQVHDGGKMTMTLEAEDRQERELLNAFVRSHSRFRVGSAGGRVRSDEPVSHNDYVVLCGAEGTESVPLGNLETTSE